MPARCLTGLVDEATHVSLIWTDDGWVVEIRNVETGEVKTVAGEMPPCSDGRVVRS